MNHSFHHAAESTTRLIIASAACFEVKELLNLLAVKRIPTTFIEVGIGSIKSAQVAARTTSLVAGRSVLFIGSCGSSEALSSDKLISGTTVVWAPPDVRHKESYLVPNAEPGIVLDPLPEGISIRQEGISCSSSITLRSEKSAGVFENLELYSVASAWRSSCRNFWSMLGVTNQLGPNAHQEWKKNFRDVAQLTANFIDAHLEKFLAADQR